jgi:hypothetical protein
MQKLLRRVQVWEVWAWECFVGTAQESISTLAAAHGDSRAPLVDYLLARTVSTLLRGFKGLRAAMTVLESSLGLAGVEKTAWRRYREPTADAVSFAAHATMVSANLWRLDDVGGAGGGVIVPRPPIPETLRLTVTLLQCSVGTAPAELDRLLKALSIAAKPLFPATDSVGFHFPPPPEPLAP